MKESDNIEKLCKYIKENEYGKLFYDVSFKDLTTIKVGGIAKVLFEPYDDKSLIAVFKEIIKNKISYFIIGNGSNLLVNDNYYEGILISLKNLNHFELLPNQIIMIEAGAKSMKVIKEITKKGIGKLEELATIPGTIGGLIYNNAGTNHITIKDVLAWIDYLDIDGKIYSIMNNDLNFAYRSSILKNKKGIILRGYFFVDNHGNIQKIEELLNKKKITQPIEKNSFGSTFKNPQGIKAYEVINKLNLEKRNINDAKISEKHANFIINEKNASFNDVYRLINFIRNKALEELNCDLQLEIEIIEDFKKIE